MKKILIILIPIVICLGLIIYNYILINSYHFSLRGSETILLNTSDKWEDPLWIIDGNKKVTITDNINYNQEGEYQVKYTLHVGIMKKTLTRDIYIKNNNQKTNFIFNLKGDNPQYLMIHHPYEEKGYEAYDANDGYLTNKVIKQDNINSDIEGNYEIKYEVKNSDGITKTITRNVIVYSFNFNKRLKTESITNENEIILSIKDSNYQYIILPSGLKSIERNINYKVHENGIYTFKIYDKNNNVIDYHATITNIDNEKPTGKCVLTLTNNSNCEINVIANDNNKIKGYIYHYGTSQTELLSSNKYAYKSGNRTASVTIYDEAGNNNKIECEVNNKINKITPKPTNSNKPSLNYSTRSWTTGSLNGVSYGLYQPSASVSGKIPLLLYFHGSAGFSVGLPTYLESGANYPFYIVCPKDNTNADFAISLISNLSTRLNIDTKRIFVSGASSGTKPALITAYQNVGRFAGVLILATYSGTPTLNAGVPMWFFQGTSDNSAHTQSIVNSINSGGGNAKLTFVNGGHDAPLPAINRQEVINWILKK